MNYIYIYISYIGYIWYIKCYVIILNLNILLIVYLIEENYLL